MNKKLLTLVTAGSIALQGIAYIEREGIKSRIDVLLNNQGMTDEMIIDMLLDSVLTSKETVYEGVLYDCLQDLPQECHS